MFSWTSGAVSCNTSGCQVSWIETIGAETEFFYFIHAYNLSSEPLQSGQFVLEDLLASTDVKDLAAGLRWSSEYRPLFPRVSREWNRVSKKLKNSSKLGSDFGCFIDCSYKL